MNGEYYKWYSSSLQQDMELKLFGQAGKTALVFPSQSGRFYQFEDFGMVDAICDFIAAGKVSCCCVDSVDDQSWCAWDLPPAGRVARHEAYERYILSEVIPFLRQHNPAVSDPYMTLGCSLGGYHAANLFFRRPDLFDSIISLSGLFDLTDYIGDTLEGGIYFHSPLRYLANLSDEWYLERYRRSRIVLACGKGAWEHLSLRHLEEMRDILEVKHVPAWIDTWGDDVNHDWHWWRKMLPYFLEHVFPTENGRELEDPIQT